MPRTRRVRKGDCPADLLNEMVRVVGDPIAASNEIRLQQVRSKPLISQPVLVLFDIISYL
jgi:hypothetical protein